jgi:hypothetical protein
MYRVLEALRRADESNEALAARLGVEVNRRADSGKVDQTDLSRTFSDKGFRRVCGGLRTWAMSNAEQWMRMLASSRDGAMWDEYKDLLYISEDFWRPAHEALLAAWKAGTLDELSADTQFSDRLRNETWILTGEPSIIDNARDREFTALQMRMDKRYVFWLPASEGPAIASRIAGEFAFSEIVDEARLQHGLRFVFGPDTLGGMPTMTFSDPHGEYPLGLTGTRTDASNIRLTVMPESMTTRTVSWLRGIYLKLARDNATTTPDGFEWRMLTASDVT